MAPEEPYHYLQKRVGSIIEELTSELSENLSEFRRISRDAYDVEAKILQSRNSYIQVSNEIEGEAKRQKEIENVLEYFDVEIEKLRQSVSQRQLEEPEEAHFTAIGDIDGLVAEFNSLVSTLDLGVPNTINILLNENMNLINYAENLLAVAASKGSPRE